MKRLTIYIILLMCFCTSGCEIVQKKRNKKADYQKPALEKVDNLKLAKIILKPEREVIDVSKDPFHPLIDRSKKKKMARKPLVTQDLKRFKFLGVAKINDEYVAYLKSGSEKGTFRKDDKVKDYTITKIAPNEVILSNGEKIITLKRGASK